jgi:hypothetical protein
MKTGVISMCAAVLVAGTPFVCKAEKAASADVVIENAEYKLVLGADAVAKSLVHKASGEECLMPGVKVPAFSITQYRP